MAKQDDYIRYTIRVPAEMYQQLKDASGEASINAEIIERLKWSLNFSPEEIRAAVPSMSVALQRMLATEVRRFALELRTHQRSYSALDGLYDSYIAQANSAAPEERERLVVEAADHVRRAAKSLGVEWTVPEHDEG